MFLPTTDLSTQILAFFFFSLCVHVHAHQLRLENAEKVEKGNLQT